MAVKPTLNGSVMFPGEYVAAEDLHGRDVNVTIARVEKTKLRDSNTEGMVPVHLIHFQGKKKPLVLNVTNARSIATMHGKEAENWADCRITLYPTKCMAWGEHTSCIRIRERIPDDDKCEAQKGHDQPPPASS